MKYNICSLGNAIVDITFQIGMDFQEKLRERGISLSSMTLIEEKDQDSLLEELNLSYKEDSFKACGGSATNTIIAASNFGANCHCTCKVSNDEFGEFYLSDLADNKISCNTKASISELPSGRCVVMVTPDAERTMCTCLGISGEVSTQDVDEEAIKNSEYLYIEGYLVTSETALAAVYKAADIAIKNGVKIALSLSDPNIVQNFKDQFLEILKRDCDLIFCNESEAINFSQVERVDNSVKFLREHSKRGFITLGSKGCLAWDQEKKLEVPAEKANPVDTNGAGDMFAGAALTALCEGYDLRKSAEFGCYAAPKKVESFGPRLTKNQYKKLKQDFFI